MGSVWLKLVSFVYRIYIGILIFDAIIYIGLHKSVKGFFLLLDSLTNSPYMFWKASLNFLCFLDTRLSDSLVRFIGFVTPRSEFFTIFLYLVLSLPLLALKILFYLVYILLKVFSFFPWLSKILLFAIFIPPLVYSYDFCSFVAYYVRTFYYSILRLFYKIIKTFIRLRLMLLEFKLFRRHMKDNGRRLSIREMAQAGINVNKRFQFEQFGNISSSKISNYYSNSDTFDLDQYLLGPIPFSVYVAGRHAHEHSKFHSVHSLIHDARFFYQPLKKRKLVRFNYQIKRAKSRILEDPAYNIVRVFEYHRYVSMGLVTNFNFSSFPEYYRSKLFGRLLRFNLIPVVNFYYSMFNNTLRNKNKNPDFWVNYGKMVTNPNRKLTWFEYSQNLLIQDPVFSYNNFDYTSPRFSRKLTNRSTIKGRFREFSISEGSRFSFDDYRSVTDTSGKVFSGSHFTQFLDDYDHYLKAKVHYKSRMERFWFKRVLLPASGLVLDKESGLPTSPVSGYPSLTRGRGLGSFFKITSVSFFGSVANLFELRSKAVLVFYRRFPIFLLHLKQFIGDFLFRVYILSVFLILRLPFFFVRGRRSLSLVYEFFTYPVKVSPFSILWSTTVFSISFSKALISVLNWVHACACTLISRFCSFVMLPVDFLKFLFICAREGSLEFRVAYELSILHKERDDFIEWLLNDSNK